MQIMWEREIKFLFGLSVGFNERVERQVTTLIMSMVLNLVKYEQWK